VGPPLHLGPFGFGAARVAPKPRKWLGWF
jgi:hypothetical protein